MRWRAGAQPRTSILMKTLRRREITIDEHVIRTVTEIVYICAFNEVPYFKNGYGNTKLEHIYEVVQ
jgi:hypothetical protein